MSNIAYITYNDQNIGIFTSQSQSIELKCKDKKMDTNIEIEYDLSNNIYEGQVYDVTLVPKPTNTAPVAIYDGQEHTNGYTLPSAGVTMTGSDRGTAAGSYEAIYTLAGNTYAWNDYTTDPVTVLLTIYNWEYPSQEDDELSITQVVNATQTNNILEVE